MTPRCGVLTNRATVANLFSVGCDTIIICNICGHQAELSMSGKYYYCDNLECNNEEMTTGDDRFMNYLFIEAP